MRKVLLVLLGSFFFISGLMILKKSSEFLKEEEKDQLKRNSMEKQLSEILQFREKLNTNKSITELIQLQKEHGDTLPFTKREIAELAATTVETTIRTISAFAKKGWVSSARGKITLKAPAEIKKLLESFC